MNDNILDSGEKRKTKQLHVSFSNDIGKTQIPKSESNEHKLKQILKLICTAAIGVIGNSESGFIFNNGKNMSTINVADDVIQHNNDPMLNAIEIDIGMPTDSLQRNATKSYIRQLQFIEALQDDEDEDWSFVLEKIITHQIKKAPRWIHKIKDNGKTILVSSVQRHLRTKVLWKDGTISWCAADALRLQNPYVYIPYIYQRPSLVNHEDFKWVKDYIKQ